ncbi:MAG: DNA polymerase III subunit delta' [Desulfovibrionaceae bacterium]
MAALKKDAPAESVLAPSAITPAELTAILARHGLARARLMALAAHPPQSLVLEGGGPREREAVALFWAALLNCRAGAGGALLPGVEPPARPCLACTPCRQILDNVFSDLHLFDGWREGVIKVEPVRELRPVWGQPPHGDGMRVTIFAEAQTMMPAAANALLKTLEEPRPGNVFVLLAPQRERLLETLVSRSFVLTLAWPDPEADDPADAEAAVWADALAAFWTTGKGWYPRTLEKGGLDAPLARRVILHCQRELVRAMTGRPGGALARYAAERMDAEARRRFDLALDQAQIALGASTASVVSPPLVLDWIATLTDR